VEGEVVSTIRPQEGHIVEVHLEELQDLKREGVRAGDREGGREGGRETRTMGTVIRTVQDAAGEWEAGTPRVTSPF
jgi:hypothetical protein